MSLCSDFKDDNQILYNQGAQLTLIRKCMAQIWAQGGLSENEIERGLKGEAQERQTGC
jgi:hypothetical protein